jgi:UDP-N-acetyl-D-glucosamine dehydrogenase
MRESPGAEIMRLIVDKGGEVAYSDPHVPTYPDTGRQPFNLEHVEQDADTLAAYDAVVLVTDHDAFDYELILNHAALIIDTRGKFRATAPNVVKA